MASLHVHTYTHSREGARQPLVRANFCTSQAFSAPHEHAGGHGRPPFTPPARHRRNKTFSLKRVAAGVTWHSGYHPTALPRRQTASRRQQLHTADATIREFHPTP